MRLVVAAACLTALAACSSSEPEPKRAPSPREVGILAVLRAKEVMSAATRDPTSVQFRDVMAVTQTAGGTTVCGSMNAKNGFGGYTGFKGFIWTPGLTVTEEATGPAQFSEVWNNICVNKPVSYLAN